jgi:hypothetical protein
MYTYKILALSVGVAYEAQQSVCEQMVHTVFELSKGSDDQQ